MKSLVKKQKANNQEGGLQMVEFIKLMISNLFIDKKEIVEQLGVQPDDIEAASGESVKCKALT